MFYSQFFKTFLGQYWEGICFYLQYFSYFFFEEKTFPHSFINIKNIYEILIWRRAHLLACLGPQSILSSFVYTGCIAVTSSLLHILTDAIFPSSPISKYMVALPIVWSVFIRMPVIAIISLSVWIPALKEHPLETWRQASCMSATSIGRSTVPFTLQG